MPQTIAGVFDEAFDLYKRNFTLILTIVAVGLVPIEVVRNIVAAIWLHPLDARTTGTGAVNPDNLIMLRLGQLFFGEPRSGFAGILEFIALIVLSAPVCVAVSDIYFGRETTARDCYRRCRPFLLNMLSGYTVVILAAIGLFAAGAIAVATVASFVVMAFSMAGIPEFGIILFIIAMAAPYFLCFGMIARHFIFMTPLTVLEGLPSSFVPFRNQQLVGRNRFWRTLWASSAVPILWVAFLVILNSAVGGALVPLHLPAIVSFAADSARSTAAYLFLAPYWTIFVTLLYYDYRVRREGFDVRVLSLAVQEATPDEAFGR